MPGRSQAPGVLCNASAPPARPQWVRDLSFPAPGHASGVPLKLSLPQLT